MHFSSEAESLQQKKLDSGKSKKGFLYSLNVPLQPRRRVSADVGWKRLFGRHLYLNSAHTLAMAATVAATAPMIATHFVVFASLAAPTDV